ncbi:MAG: hypothetical protein ABI665_01050 [Vicinamibacterales bacterium]
MFSARARHWSIVSVLIVFGLSGSAFAQTPANPQALADARAEVERLKQELAAMREQYDKRLADLEQRLTTLAEAPPPAAAEPPSTAASAAAAAGSSKVFNPDMSVNGNFVGVGGKNPNSDQPPLNLSEVEMAFQAIVDPYARADFFLSASPQGLEVEEGFVTFNTLPGGLLFKGGKMRAQFGKANTLHTHALPYIDRPLVTENLVGGEEGISEPGVSLSKLFPSSAVFLEATGEAYYSNSEVFASSQRSKLNYVARLRAYRDITEGSNIDVGGSYAYGPSAKAPETFVAADTSTELVGFDATFRYRPLRRAIYRRFQARTELVWSRPKAAGRIGDRSFGYYGLGEYQFARRWYAGARYDRSAQPIDPALVDTGGSFFLTYWPSEFSQVRGQYRRTNYGDGVNANEFLFQLNFSIGAHGAHVF